MPLLSVADLNSSNQKASSTLNCSPHIEKVVEKDKVTTVLNVAIDSGVMAKTSTENKKNEEANLASNFETICSVAASTTPSNALNVTSTFAPPNRKKRFAKLRVSIEILFFIFHG